MININEESSFTYNYLNYLKPVQPYYVESSKIHGGYISQSSREKARKKKNKRNKRK